MTHPASVLRAWRAPSVALLLLGSVYLGAGCSAGNASDESVGEESQELGPFTYDWLQFYGDGRHLGNNTQETILGQSSVSGLIRLFQVHSDATNYFESPPVILRSVTTPSGVHDLAFLRDAEGHACTRSDARNRSDSVDGIAAQSPDREVHDDRHRPSTRANNSSGDVRLRRQGPQVQRGQRHRGHDGRLARGHHAQTRYREGHHLPHARDRQQRGYVPLHGHERLRETSSTTKGIWTSINLAHGCTDRLQRDVQQSKLAHFVNTPGTPDCSMCCTARSGARPTVVYNPTTNRIYCTTGDGTFDAANHHWG